MTEPTTDLSSIRYVAHLADDGDLTTTACGEPWQGWQAPKRVDRRNTVPPHDLPRPHTDLIRQCQACWRVAMLASFEAASGAGGGIDAATVTGGDTTAITAPTSEDIGDKEDQR